MTVRTHNLTGVVNGDPFKKAYPDRLFIGTNGFQWTSNNGVPDGSYLSWEFEVDNSQPASSECQPGLVANQSVYLRYKNQSTIPDRVKAFPCVTIGALGGTGRTEIPGLGCGHVTVLADTEFARRSNLPPGYFEYLTDNSRNTPVYDLEQVKALSGLPAKVGELEDIRIDYDVDRSNGANENLFLDLYVCDVSTLNRIPGGFPGPGYGTIIDGSLYVTEPLDSSETQLLNTVNGLNYNLTKDWNINVWMGLPAEPNGGSTDSDGNWAGGRLVGRYTIGGVEHDFYYKIETSGANNFDYIGLVQIGTAEAGQIRVQDYINWAKNDLPNIIATNSVANEQYYGTTANPRSKPPPRFIDDAHVLANCDFGCEIWSSKSDGSEAVIRFKQLEFTVPSIGTFGWKDESTVAPSVVNTNTIGVLVNQEVYVAPGDVSTSAALFTDAPMITPDNIIVIRDYQYVDNGTAKMRIEGLNEGTATVTYEQSDGTTGAFTVVVSPDTGTVDPGDNSQFSRNYNETVQVGDELKFQYTDIHSSGSPVKEITAESGSTHVQIMGIDPEIRVRGLSLGESVIAYELQNGQRGNFTITTVSAVDDDNDTDSQNPYIGKRYIPAGGAVVLETSKMPLLAGATPTVGAVTGDATAVATGTTIQISAPAGANDAGEVEIV